MPRLLFIAPLFLALAAPALATDGVLEINQTCAVETGCFPGDTPGFPVTITSAAGQSYQLTSDLNISDADLTVILISTSDVTVDLVGFRIRCRRFVPPASFALCGETGGSGVGLSASQQTGIEVRNGSIVGMGFRGLSLGSNAVVRNLRVFQNGGNGISTGVGSTISGNTAYNSRFNGAGIFAGAGSTVSGNTAYSNEANGVSAGDGSTISGNTLYANGQNGISAGEGSIVRGNAVRENSGYGLNLGTDAAYGENVVTANTTGTVDGDGRLNSRGGNYCAGTGTGSAFCP